MAAALEADVQKAEDFVFILDKSLQLASTEDAENKNPAGIGGVDHSYAGIRSRGHAQLETAEQMERDGATSEEIRRETNWFRGMDGIWRYEINDRDMRVDLTGALKSKEFSRYVALESKWMQGEITKDEINEFKRLADALRGTDRKPEKLGELIDHPALFAAYPELRDVHVAFVSSGAGVSAYDSIMNGIQLDPALMQNKEKLRSTLAHEIQHAIQEIEGFAAGTSPGYWSSMEYAKTAVEEKQENAAKDLIRKTERDIRDNFNEEALRGMQEAWRLQQWEKNKTLNEEGRAKLAAMERQFAENGMGQIYRDYIKAMDGLKAVRNRIEDRQNTSSYSNYYRTAGEIEARDVANRLGLTDAERKEKRPDIDRTDVVFADGGLNYSIKRTSKMPWNKQVNGYFAFKEGKKNKIQSSDTLVLNNFSNPYSDSNLPYAFPLSTISDSQSGRNEYHKIQDSTIFWMDMYMGDWDIYIKNPLRNAEAYVLNTPTEKLPVVVAFEMDTIFDDDHVNRASSIHQRQDVQAMLNNLPSEATVYIKNKTADLHVPGTFIKTEGLNTAARLVYVDDTIGEKESQEKTVDHSKNLDAVAEEALEAESGQRDEVLEQTAILRSRAERLAGAAVRDEDLAALLPGTGTITKILRNHNFASRDGKYLTEKSGAVHKMLQNLYTGRVSFANFMLDLQNLMLGEIENAGHWESLGDGSVADFRREVRGSKIYLSPDIYDNVAESFGGRRGLRNAVMGKFWITSDPDKSKGTALDVFYADLLEQHYGLPETTDPT